MPHGTLTPLAALAGSGPWPAIAGLDVRPAVLDALAALLAALNGALRDAVLATEAPAAAADVAADETTAGGREQAVAEDEADIRATLGGDGRAFARLVARHQHGVARHLLRFARDGGTLESLVQDTFVEAWSSLAGYRGRSSLQSWLLAIATRVGYRHWKREARGRRETALEALSPEERAELEAAAAAASTPGRPAADPSVAAALVHRLLARLSPRDRLVITLLHLDGRSVAETAELTGWSRAMVKVQAFRARGRLRALLDPNGELR